MTRKRKRNRCRMCRVRFGRRTSSVPGFCSQECYESRRVEKALFVKAREVESSDEVLWRWLAVGQGPL